MEHLACVNAASEAALPTRLSWHRAAAKAPSYWCRDFSCSPPTHVPCCSSACCEPSHHPYFCLHMLFSTAGGRVYGRWMAAILQAAYSWLHAQEQWGGELEKWACGWEKDAQSDGARGACRQVGREVQGGPCPCPRRKGSPLALPTKSWNCPWLLSTPQQLQYTLSQFQLTHFNFNIIFCGLALTSLGI